MSQTIHRSGATIRDLDESRAPFETGPAALETVPASLESARRAKLSLFWRTFFLLACCCWAVSWPGCRPFGRWSSSRARCKARSNWPRWSTSAAPRWCTPTPLPASRWSRPWPTRKAVRIAPREPTDTYRPYNADSLSRRISRAAPGSAWAPAPWLRSEVNNKAGSLDRLQHRRRSLLAANRPFAHRARRRHHLADLAGHGGPAVPGWCCADCAPDQPPAQEAVVCGQPGARRRFQRPASSTNRWPPAKSARSTSASTAWRSARPRSSKTAP